MNNIAFIVGHGKNKLYTIAINNDAKSARMLHGAQQTQRSITITLIKRYTT